MARDFDPGVVSRDEVEAPGRRAATRSYTPYAVDGRFLPEELLMAKDCLRHALVAGSNAVARMPRLSGLWATTLGRGPAKAVTKAGVLFIHIPRTGGTSISQVLYRRNLPHYTARFWREVFGGGIAGMPSFAVVRHPTERLLSAYRMALHGGTDIVAYSRFWRSRLRGLGSFETFVDFVAEHRTRPEGLPLDLWDQGAFILDGNGAVMVDRLCSLDDRNGLPAELRRWLSAPPIPHINATAPSAVDLTVAVRRKIAQAYERDFAIYDAVVARAGSAELRDHLSRTLGAEPQIS